MVMTRWVKGFKSFHLQETWCTIFEHEWVKGEESNIIGGLHHWFSSSTLMRSTQGVGGNSKRSKTSPKDSNSVGPEWVPGINNVLIYIHWLWIKCSEKETLINTGLSTINSTLHIHRTSGNHRVYCVFWRGHKSSQEKWKISHHG